MHFEESESSDLKSWLVKRLEDISDADSDVLADYVLALIKSDDPEAQVKENCLENLKDFLGDNTETFVKDVFAALEKKSYLPGYVPPKPSRTLTATASSFTPSFNPPSAPSASYIRQGSFNEGNANGQGDQSRKRGFNDREGSESSDRHDSHYGRGNGDRAIKQSRRGGPDGVRRGRGGFHNGSGSNGAFQQPQIPQMPALPPGFPSLDPNNPMAAIMAMQAMGFPSLPGFPQFPGPLPSASPTGFMQSSEFPDRPAQIGERCRDYDTKGYCAIGSMCPYEHGANRIVIPGIKPEYDPRTATLSPDFGGEAGPSFESQRGQRGNGLGRGRGHPRGGRGSFPNGQRGGRALFSSAGPNNNQSITKIVIEQIPEDKFNEGSVREFFSEFGTIQDVELRDFKRLAIVNFADYASAKRAWESPKVIFDNRFVKVYWFKPETVTEEEPIRAPAIKASPEDEEMIDPEEFAQKQAEAQRVHEEKARKMKEAETAREELEKKIKAQAEERKRLMEKLSAKAASSATSTTKATNGSTTAAITDTKPGTPAPTSNAAPSKSISQTDALRAKLAELEAEAETLGLAPEESATPAWGAQPYRGRGGYVPFARGGGYRARGVARGGWRGFGGINGGGASVARLDNRPKSVEVKAADTSVDFGDEKVLEGLRAHLFGIGDFASITPSSGSASTADLTSSSSAASAIVTFNERYVAEIFINSSSYIPGIGAATLSWVANNNVATPSTAATSAATDGGASSSSPVVTSKLNGGAVEYVGGAEREGKGRDGGGGVVVKEEGAVDGGTVMDYDVADEEDEDRWMR